MNARTPYPSANPINSPIAPIAIAKSGTRVALFQAHAPPKPDHAGSQTSSLGFAYQSRGSTALFVILPTFAAPGIGFSGS
jgi:hypothetical protein